MTTVLHFPTSKKKREEVEAETEEEKRIALSSEVRDVSEAEFERIQREHEEAVIRQAVLARFDEF